LERVDLSAAHSFGVFRDTNFYDSKIKEVNVDGDEGLQWDALIRYHLKVDPDKLKDEDYFKLAAGLEWVIRQENEKYKKED
tara:strand:+ start:530 stop:772 length:243 start_codon:yes stop_codon:yes gene_type:complete